MMGTRRLVVVDTETTSLRTDRRPWEVLSDARAAAAIYRHLMGGER